MLLKISLALAILVGLATLYFTIPVSDKITGLETTVTTAQAAQKTAEEGQRKATAEARQSKTAFEVATKELADATNRLTGVTAMLAEQQKRANKSSTDLVAMTEERNEARRELNKWSALGIPAEKVRETLENSKRLELERNELQVVNKSLTKTRNDLQARLDRYERPEDREIPLPAGTRGKIVAVDPKYDFVVMDIGGNQQLVEGAKMLVNRDGKLVAKVKITRVEPNRAIANVMPEWKQDEIMEGDQVVY